MLLQQDNARPHTAKKTLQNIEELEGFELLQHPAFNPDLVPSDYYLFRSMAQFLHGKCFNL
jgi:histone-lysine N-methyltransferase SETMAR